MTPRFSFPPAPPTLSPQAELTESQPAFLPGNRLPENWRDKAQFVILETGFGSGANFLTTWAAWQADPHRPQKLHYLATEAHPFRAEELAHLQRHWHDLAVLAQSLRQNWPILMPGFHRLEFAASRVVLTLMLGDSENENNNETSLRKLRASVDAFYFNTAFKFNEPSASQLRRCVQLAAQNATFASRSRTDATKQALSAAGFVTEERPELNKQSEVLAGRMADRPKMFIAPSPTQPRHAVIIGAGLAGCAIAERLAVRGWRVTVLDQHAEPAGEASGNLAGILRPIISRDDNLSSRLSRACFLYLQRHWQHLDQAGSPPRRNLSGILQIASDAEHEALMRDWLAASDYPNTFIHFLDQPHASTQLGAQTAYGGWYFPLGGWASPASLCQAALRAGGRNICFQGGVEVARLEPIEMSDLPAGKSGWRLFNPAGESLAEASVVVFATGAAPLEVLSPLTALPITPVRGQVSHLPGGSLPKLAHPVCSDGYLTPEINGVHCLGASYIHRPFDTELRSNEHSENLHRLSRILPGAERAFETDKTVKNATETITGRVGLRATTPDHLPLAGALPDISGQLKTSGRFNTFPRQPGLFGLLGLGSRGLVWSSLLAEHLACLINSEPSPLEGDLIDAIDPARFALRAQRQEKIN